MMGDDADVANDFMQHMIDVGVKNAHDKIKKPSNQTGKCIWCETPVKDDRRWCSTECRNEFEKYAK
jgi:hypothetical protein